MKRVLSVIGYVFVLLVGAVVTCAIAGPIPQGDTQVSPLGDLNVKMGLQYRVMWNGSNIPLSGVTSATDTESYNFFRQRMRFNVDVQPTEDVGGFLQLEYRGGWGGGSPMASDPRGVGLTLNAFNRLSARGVRYGYIYYTPEDNTYLAAGIIPISDQIGDILFSADWDFNVGGILCSSAMGPVTHRLGFVRLIDGVGSTDRDTVGGDGSLFIGDVNGLLGTVKVGGHVYFLYTPEDVAIEAGLPGKISQGWYALSGSAALAPVTLNALACLNNGKYGSDDNTGLAVKAEVEANLGTPTLKVLGAYSTGDAEGEAPDKQFRTIQGIFGTEGYWAYTHLFTPNGPSDVNDLGVGLDMGGRGLITLQAKADIPVMPKLNGELSFGWFQATEENSAGDNQMGTEVGGMLTCAVAKGLNLQIGAAVAFLGDYYKTGGQDPDTLYEIFSRFQLQF